jgi:hypothetical protein
MSLTIAQVLNDSHYALGGWQTDQAKVLQYMTQFNTNNDLIAYLQQNKNNPAVVGPVTAEFPQWAVSAMGDQVGTNAAYLTTEIAPIIIEAAAQGWPLEHLQNAISQTPYYQAHSQAQLTWQTKSVADRNVDIGLLQARMAKDARDLYGPDWTSGAIPGLTFEGLHAAAEMVASGGMTYDVWHFETQRAAETASNTPAARAVVDAQAAVGQRATDVANLTQRLGDTWRTWVGDQYPPQDLAGWAQRINMNQASEADFVASAKTMSAGLYPNKPRDLDYTSWVQQPKSLIAGTLEMPTVKDSDLLLQSYLRGNIANLGDLKLAAQQDPRYDATVTARDQMTQLGSHILSTWGFAPGAGL